MEDTKMRTKEIEERLKEIEDMKGDPEVAHSKEDQLFLDFIQSVSLRCDDIGKQAKLVLTSKNIEFGRFTS